MVKVARVPHATAGGDAVIITVKLTAVYTRDLTTPARTFFLFGPRGTGKSTWLRERFAAAAWFDLLEERRRLRYLRDPSLFAEEVSAAPKAAWVVVDEVQQVPGLLNEVHRLIEQHRFKFALSGSSARKLKRGQANLLGGRALVHELFPLTWKETRADAATLDDLVWWGGLPLVHDAGADRADLLEAYCSTYLREEIQAEALVRNLGGFSRFLDCAALANGQVTNVSALSRDAQVQRTTVHGYFEILEDTLVGRFLPAWRPRAKVKEQAHPKFYWFDTGVARALAGRHRLPLAPESRGAMLETWLHHELRAWLHYRRLPGTLSHWRTPSGTEVDFIWHSGDRVVAIEVKSSTRWRSSDSTGLNALLDGLPGATCFGVYLGSEKRRHGKIDLLPLPTFLERLYAGRVLTP